EFRDPVDHESGEREPERGAFAQNGDPGQSRLEGLQAQSLEQGVVAVQRATPLLIVIVAVDLGIDRPRAADRCIGGGHERSGPCAAPVLADCASASWAWSSSMRAASRASAQSTSPALYPRTTCWNRRARTSAPEIFSTGRMVAVVPSGSGPSSSDRPKSAPASRNNTVATKPTIRTYSSRVSMDRV